MIASGIIKFDGLGRKTSVTHSDAGLTTFEYDAAGNITAKQTPPPQHYEPDQQWH